MDTIKEYLLTVISCGILCAIACRLLENKGVNGMLVKLIAGIIMTLTLIMPFNKLDLSDINAYWRSYSFDADIAVAEGVNQSKQVLREGIKLRCEEYILKEAVNLNLDVSATVQLSDNDLPVPTGVMLKGSASPYAKNALTQSICTAFDLEKEKVQWT